jgi:glutamate-1-semialdehyde aminotransferase
VGAFGGRADVMNYYDPRGGKGRINHGGTFNANPLTMAGGVATMEQLTPEPMRGSRPSATGCARASRRRCVAQVLRARSPARLAVLAAPHQEAAHRLSLAAAGRPTASRGTFMALINEGF